MRRPKLTPEAILELREMRAQGASMIAMRRRHNHAESTILKHLKDIPAKPRRSKLPPMAQVYQMVEVEGRSQQEVAHEYDVCTQTVAAALKRYRDEQRAQRRADLLASLQKRNPA